MNADVEKAVEVVRTALNDWTVTHAPEFCDKANVVAARRRISGEGTLGYICDALGAVNKVHLALRDQEAEIANLKRCVSHECIVAEDHIRIAREYADLLRDVSRYLDPRQFSEVIDRITAHLGASHG